MRKRHIRFTRKEDSILKILYANSSFDRLLRMLPGRSKQNIWSRAGYLGLSRNSTIAHLRQSTLSVKSVANELPETDKAYLAGLIDGEGCLYVKAAESGGVIVRLDVVSNTNQKVIAWVEKKLRPYCRVYCQSKLGRKKKIRRVVLHNRRAVLFLREVFPYLVIKKDRAQMLLKGYWHLSKAQKRDLVERLRKHG